MERFNGLARKRLEGQSSRRRTRRRISSEIESGEVDIDLDLDPLTGALLDLYMRSTGKQLQEIIPNIVLGKPDVGPRSHSISFAINKDFIVELMGEVTKSNLLINDYLRRALNNWMIEGVASQAEALRLGWRDR